MDHRGPRDWNRRAQEQGNRMSEVGPYETHAQKILEPLRRWRSRNFGFLTPKESNDLIQLMEGVVRRAKMSDARLETNK